jgi:hypothetical protein
MHVFGPQPVMERAWLRNVDDEGDGIPVVYRDLIGVQIQQLNREVVTRYPTEIEQTSGWVWETLVQGLDSIDGKALPDDEARRREIVMHWPQGPTEKVAGGFAAFQDDIRASYELVMYAPKPRGANAGPSSARKAAGQGSPSAE